MSNSLSQAAHGTPQNPYSSASRWRHQESSSFSRHAVSHPHPDAAAAQAHIDGVAPQGLNGDGPVSSGDSSEVVCGPLLNYCHMQDGHWEGSVLIVLNGGGKKQGPVPVLSLQRAGARGQAGAEAAGAPVKQISGFRLYSDPRNTFWRFDITVPMEPTEVQYAYEFPGLRFSNPEKPQVNRFSVPAAGESMRLMFHSCNGFSVGTDEEAFSGTPLWKDVLRKHEAAPFHVMLGGGDQIYNDGIRVSGPLRPWTDISNPKKRRDFPFSEQLRAECDDYYLKNYLRWYNTAPFAIANGQIPQVNIWDDHDIIDGFGSYVNDFMTCDVFRGIGGTAHKYYMIFQHHLAPPVSTYTSGKTPTVRMGADPAQQVDTFVAEQNPGSQYIIGAKPGPYVAERSFNMYARLGARMAMLGIDARTERTRHQVNYPETYKLLYQRLRDELQAAASSEQPIDHLILLLGIPIAYPFLSRRFGIGGGLFNHFDGSVDLLDDLDDHYTAKTHKAERRELIESMQKIAAEYNVRVTILGGDVHLAALGRFYSNPKLKIPVEEDSRYMANIVSSAIVNKPPPQAVANLLARRNKIHHLNEQTDETMLDLFDRDPGSTPKTAGHNKCTMPSRNFAMITENSPNNPAAAAAAVTNGATETKSFVGKDGHAQMHQGEVGAGTGHRAASDAFGQGNDGSLDIRINVEKDQHNAEGPTQAYGLTVPVLRKRAAGGPQ
ncbi:transcription factor btf3, putative [Cordyceps militaris CM01]|uniref:Transcription factor btf3, putative n=1 Tax=Cordyceps militaris (strain CM01) TaxID=983644 RepID=G3JLA8_CORMM|nr:transcription factor btf3, putative [Cordyceps militaris CM01]EGX90482.1 transcription factor btf3, putative [Cordyceps militaris CM01]